MTPSSQFSLDAALETISHHQGKMLWARRGLMLRRARSDYDWPSRGEGTFGRMVEQLALALSTHSSVLWRDLKAVDYLETSLRQKLLAEGIDVPDLENVPVGVNTEVLNALERIEMAVSHQEFINLAKTVMRGEMSRPTIRKYWDAVKPALQGKTMRGLKEKPERSERPAFVLEQKALAWLIEQGAGWLGEPRPFGYQLISERNLLDLCAKVLPKENSPDALALVQRVVAPALEIHGIEIRSKLDPNPRVWRKIYPDMTDPFDYFWVIIPHQSDIRRLSALDIPSWIGVIAGGVKVEAEAEGAFTLVRRAEQNPRNVNAASGKEARAKLMEALIAYGLKHHYG